MVTEVLELLRPRAGGVYIDGTLGGGGHAEAVLQASAPDGRLLGIDRDPDALAAAGERLAPFGDRVQLLRARFDELPELWDELGLPAPDGMLLDLGVSSHQLNTPERGFSFQRAGPLDMRMDPDDPEDALDLLDRLSRDELRALLRAGDVPRPGRVAGAIHARRQELSDTLDLARVVESVLGRPRPARPGRPRRRHPATVVFQALRVAVNSELQALDGLLRWLPEPLPLGGRIVIISYHSLEDRLVKRAFRDLSRSCTCPPHLPVCVCDGVAPGRLASAGPLRPSAGELASNPRSRSAVLRAWQRGHDARA